MEKTSKYGPLRWELKQRHPNYKVTQHNIIIVVLGVLQLHFSTNI